MLTVGVFTCVCHGKFTGGSVLEFARKSMRQNAIKIHWGRSQVLIWESVAVDRLKSRRQLRTK